MNERISTDTDAGLQSTVGVGNVDVIVSSLLKEVQPSWVADGHGVRGPQRPRERELAVKPSEMKFSLPTGQQRSSPTLGSCTPTAPPESGTAVWGAVDGECQWIETTTCDS